MRKVFAVVFMMLAMAMSVQAQSVKDVVYLKNGSVVYGNITEIKPDQNVKIKTSDGSIFVYEMSQVDKITKSAASSVSQSKSSNYDDEYGWSRAPRYRGFVGDSYLIGLDDYTADCEFFYTSHGCQIIPELYAGIGVGAKCYFSGSDYVSNAWSVPIFMHLRSELHRSLGSNASPYFDVKIGGAAADVSGFFFNPSLGCHFYFGHSNVGLSVNVGYCMQSTDFYTYYSHHGDITYKSLELGVALDF